MKQIPLFKVFMADSVQSAVTSILYSGYIGQGKKVDEFERVLQQYFNNNRVLTTNSATSAEHLALKLLERSYSGEYVNEEYGAVKSQWPGLEKGDEILCSPLTCTATNWPVILGGYKIKWVDIDPRTLNMDLDDLARKITPKTKVIMLPLWGGMPVDFDKIKDIQEQARNTNGFAPALIVDAAHALGSKFNGKHVCNFGHITTYSFQAIKHVTSVDGGAVVMPHQSLQERGKLMRWYGIRRDDVRTDFRCENDISEIGTKWHMNDVNATIGIENFKHTDFIIEKHIDNALWYDHYLSKNLNAAVSSGITLLERPKKFHSSSWLYTILVEDRESFMRMMGSKGITVSRVHERNDKHSAISHFKTQLPSLESVINKYVCIPVGWWVTDEDRNYILDSIKSGW